MLKISVPFVSPVFSLFQKAHDLDDKKNQRHPCASLFSTCSVTIAIFITYMQLQKKTGGPWIFLGSNSERFCTHLGGHGYAISPGGRN